MVTCGDNHSESLVNRTLGQKSRAVHVAVSQCHSAVFCTDQGIAVLLPQMKREV